MSTSDEHDKLLSAIQVVDGRVSEVSTKLDRVANELEGHIAAGHAQYVQRSELKAFIDKMEEWIEESRTDRKSLRQAQHDSDVQQDRLADVLLGDLILSYDGQIKRQGGIKQIVDAYSAEKGFKVAIPWAQVGAIITTMIGAVVAIVIALIQFG